MSRLVIALLALGLIGAGAALDRRQRQRPATKADLDQWEGEGGAVPVAADRIAAQTTAGD